MSTYNLFTAFQQKMWKTPKSAFFFKGCCALVCLCLLVSCSSMNPMKWWSKKKEDPRQLDNALISMNEEEIKKRLGEPEVVSRTPENNVIWTYHPSWKLMPDNKGTIYVEFDQGRVTKVVKKKR